MTRQEHAALLKQAFDLLQSVHFLGMDDAKVTAIKQALSLVNNDIMAQDNAEKQALQSKVGGASE